MLVLDDISYCVYGDDKAPLLKNISCQIEAGSMLAVMGLNGSGKTMLLRIMSHYLKPSSGVVKLGKKLSADLSSKELARHIAFVPQDFPTDFPFTVLQFVMMGRFAWQSGLFYQQQDFDKVEKVLERLLLSDFRDRVIATLSGGERQRVLIARAIVQESPCILLDEPLNHLDVKNKLEILKILKHENEVNQKTIVAVLHDFHDVRENFKQVLFLKEGLLCFLGPVAEGLKKQRLSTVFDIEGGLSFSDHAST